VPGRAAAQGRARGDALPQPAEIACLAEVVRPGYRALVFVGAYGGLRIGELAGLRRSRVDLDADTVVLTRLRTDPATRAYATRRRAQARPTARSTAA
jgi:integrase